MFSQQSLIVLLQNHEIDADQKLAIAVLRERALRFAEAVVAYTKASPDQSAAIRHIREALWSANAAVSIYGIESVPPPIEPKID